MKVYIENLTFDTIIGILDFERTTPQQVIINLSFKYKFNKDSKEFINYAEVSTLIEKLMKEKQYLLIEEAIIDIKSTLKQTFNIKKINLKITKPNILSNTKVSVSN